MGDKKIFAGFCPKCRELCQVQIITKVALGPGVQVDMSCVNGHKWSEFYSLDYQGYWWDGKMYDSYGEEKAKEVGV